MTDLSADLSAVRGRHILVALSGGADSVALLYLLHECNDLTLSAAHFNHGIRGSDADADEAFCARLCASLGITFISGRADIPSLAVCKKQGLETAAREARYRFLYGTADRIGADFIALAHHADDQVETVLMHLFRGTGPEGIGGMRTLSGRLFRPLLGIRKHELIKYLTERGIPWCEDTTNNTADNPRNALRLDILPEIEKFYPGASDAILRYAETAALESDHIAEAAQNIPVEYFPFGYRLDLSTPVPEAILRRVLRGLCGRAADHAAILRLVNLCSPETIRGKMQISKSLLAERIRGNLYILRDVPQPEPVSIRPESDILFGGWFRIRTEYTNRTIDCSTDHFVECLDVDALKGSVLRTRMNGDRIHPLGCSGSKLLSDYLTDRHIDRPLKDHLPLIARGNDILWVCGAGISAHAAVTVATHAMVKLTAEKQSISSVDSYHLHREEQT